VTRTFRTEMARTFSASRIVFNDAVKRDLNMRVFEALASGALLLTDRAPGSGLDEMFVDREHLVLYDDTDVEALAAYYLEHEDERLDIAARGRAEVLRWHTYDHRARALVDAVFEPAAAPSADEWRIGVVDDPLVTEGVALTNARRFGEALDRFDLVHDHRELHPYERLTMANARATCLRQLGRDEESVGAHVAALAGLPPAFRGALQSIL